MNDPGFDERIALPVPPVQNIILFQGGEARRQRPAVAKWPQAHIDPIDETIVRGFVEDGDEALAQTVKEFLMGQRARAALRFATGPIGKNKIDVGRKIKLATAQFAHGDHHQRDRPATLLRWGAKTRGEIPVQPLCHGVDQRLG